MNGDRTSKPAVVEIVDVVTVAPDDAGVHDEGRHGSGSFRSFRKRLPEGALNLSRWAREHPAALVVAAGALGLVIGRLIAGRAPNQRTLDQRTFASRVRSAWRAPVLRRPAAQPSSGSLKAHGDKLGSAISAVAGAHQGSSRAPTYPEG